MSVIGSNVLAGASGQSAGGAAGAGISRSLRFNSGDSAYLNRTPSSAGNRKTWTWSGWVKRSVLGSQKLFIAGASGTEGGIQFHSGTDNTAIRFYDYQSGAHTIQLDTTQLFRDVAGWYHIVGAIDTTQATASDRVKLYINGVQVTSFATATYPSQNLDTLVNNNIAHYLGWVSPSGNYFNGYLADVHFIDGQALAATDFGETNTDNLWVPKAFAGSYGTNGFRLGFADNSSNAALGTDTSGNSNTWTVNNLTASSAGFSQYIAQGTTSGSFHQYGPVTNLFDGSASTGAFSSSGTSTFTFGGSSIVASTSIKIRGFKADGAGGNVLVNGTNIASLLNAQSSGGYLTVDVTSTLGGAPITLASVSVVNAGTGGSGNIAQIFVDDVELITGNPGDNDSLVDTPTNGDTASDTGAGGEITGCYCTQSPIDSNSGITLSNGNLDLNRASNSWVTSRGTIGMTSGKYYWEATFSSGLYMHIGIQKSGSNLGSYVGDPATGWGYSYQGTVYNNQVETSYGNSYTTNDTIGVAFDADAGNIYFYKNGVIQNSGTAAYTGLTDGPYIPAISLYGTIAANINFGQRAFAYAAPSGYKSLNSANLSSTIADGSLYFDTKLYTGNGGTQSIGGLGFSPDLCWIKSRSSTQWHFLADTVRGNTKNLASNDTYQEETRTNRLTSFDSNGFSLGNNSTTNENNSTFASWSWDAGSSTVSNTDGTITSQVRVNQTAGFSIVTYTGVSGNQSFGHGLNVKPKFIAIKNRSNSANWFAMFDTGAASYQYGHLNDTTAFAAASAQPVSNTTVTLGNNNSWFGAAGDDYIAYCFAPVEGYSSVGTYSGNQNADGPFVYTGFKVAMLWVKRTDVGADWFVWDKERGGANFLCQSGSYTENVTANGSRSFPVDILSNGFKIRTDGTNVNGPGTFAYIAWAENPFASNGGLAR